MSLLLDNYQKYNISIKQKRLQYFPFDVFLYLTKFKNYFKEEKNLRWKILRSGVTSCIDKTFKLCSMRIKLISI